MNNRGTYIEFEGRPAVKFERNYPCSAERVWTAITDPSELAHWFPATVESELRPGGTISFSFPDEPDAAPTTGRVLHVDPPRRLAYTWEGDELHFEITPTSEGCTLTFVNVLDERDTAARNAAGWTLCLDVLDELPAGRTRVGAEAPWQPVYEAYVAGGMPHGAAVPGQ
jgi:uncharacterized protein YndB with AHSA1/START domain